MHTSVDLWVSEVKKPFHRMVCKNWIEPIQQRIYRDIWWGNQLKCFLLFFLQFQVEMLREFSPSVVWMGQKAFSTYRKDKSEAPIIVSTSITLLWLFIEKRRQKKKKTYNCKTNRLLRHYFQEENVSEWFLEWTFWKRITAVAKAIPWKDRHSLMIIIEKCVPFHLMLHNQKREEKWNNDAWHPRAIGSSSFIFRQSEHNIHFICFVNRELYFYYWSLDNE